MDFCSDFISFVERGINTLVDHLDHILTSEQKDEMGSAFFRHSFLLIFFSF